MKYRLRDKRKRNQNILAYKATHSELTLEEIALKFGISKQRVGQILKKYAEVAKEV